MMHCIVYLFTSFICVKVKLINRQAKKYNKVVISNSYFYCMQSRKEEETGWQSKYNTHGSTALL